MDPSTIASKIDHTLLKPDATKENIKQLCDEAVKQKFYSVCINSIWLKDAYNFLLGSTVKLCTVSGFPLGVSSTSCKLHELEISIQDGASEIDMVMNIGFFKDKKYKIVSDEISSMVTIAQGKIIKVIIESGILTKEEVRIAAKLVEDSGAQFVKTSTGFSAFGASTEIINIIKKALKSDTKIKASGGIKSFYQVQDLLDAGAKRIGTSSGVIIMKEFTGK
jgi:deoxyribose-phosphate aldolase